MKVLGKDPARLIGSVLWDEFPDVPNEEAVRRVVSEGVAVTDELYYAPLGEWVENHMYPSPDGGLVTFQKYITERKREQAELTRVTGELADDLEAMKHLHELSTQLMTANGIQSLLEEILSATITLQHADFGNVQLYNPATKSLEIVVQRGFKQDFLDHFSVVAEDSSACGRALQRGERVIIEDVESDPGFAPHRQIAAAAGFRAVQSTPLVSRSGEPLGMLSTHFRHPHRPSEREIRLTDLYARQATEMIEHKRAEEALRHSVKRLLTTIREREAVESALQHQHDELRASEHRLAMQYAITCNLAESDTLADAMPRLLQTIGERLAWEWGALWAIERDAGVLRCAHIWHAPNLEAEALDAISRQTAGLPGQGLKGRVWQNGEPTWMADVTQDPHFMRAPFAARMGLRSAVAFPILRRGETLGILEFFSRAIAPPDAAQLAMLVAIGNQIGQFVERKRAEAQLAASERRFRLVADAIPHLVWSCLPDGTMEYCNQRWVEYTGLPVADTQDYGWTTCLHPDDVDPAVAAWQEAKARGTPYEVEQRVRGRDGRYRRFLSRAAPLCDEQGQLLQWFGTYTDLEERQQAEDALHEAQAALAHATRVTMLGELTASIAHEVNQPLGALVTNGQACLRLLAREAPDLQKVRDVIERVISDGLRASDVIRRIRALVTRKDEEKAWLHVNEIIQEVIALTSPELSQCEIHLQIALTAGLPPALGDRVQLQQVILNLILNAKEVMSGVGWQPRELWITSRASPSGEVLVAVRDSGTGLDPGDGDRIFDAFFTRKPEGLGLGLSISRRIIEAHGGRLWATPNEDHGTTMQFALPASGRTG